MRIVPCHEYQFNSDTNAYELLSKSVLCTRCGCAMQRHGRRKRTYIDENGAHHTVQLVRVHCPECGKTDTLLPQNLLPGKRYSAACVELGLEHADNLQATCLGCEESTVRAWLTQYQRIRELLAQGARKTGKAPPPECPRSGRPSGWLGEYVHNYVSLTGQSPYHRCAYEQLKAA